MAPPHSKTPASKSAIKSGMALLSDLIRGILYTITGLLENITTTINKSLQLANNTMYVVKKTAIIATAIVIVLFVILGTAISTYIIFYIAYVPIFSAYTDIKLDFGVRCRLGDGVCGYQSANLSVLPIDGQQAFPMMERGQFYKMTVLLDMPEDYTNMEAGEFNLVAQTYGIHGSEIQTATSQVQLAQPGYVKRLLRFFLFVPRWLVGRHIRDQHMDVNLIPHYEEDLRMSTLGICIEIQNNAVNINEAYLRVRTLFSGIKYALYQYPVTTALIGISFIFSFLFVISLVVAYGVFFVLLPMYSNLSHAKSASTTKQTNSIPSNRMKVEMLSAGATGMTTITPMMDREELHYMKMNTEPHLDLRQRVPPYSSDC